MKKREENARFTCANCGKEILPLTNGSVRNHCPYCLYSLHVDIYPGDRACGCSGLMAPVSIRYHSKKGWQIVHRCLTCGFERANRTAENTEQSDSMEEILKIIKRSER